MTRKLIFSIPSFCLGAWAFYKVNQISGPAFEPILAACTNPDISVDDFAHKTGYHSYEPKLGLGAFKVLVCLITQFLLELRETYPAGIITWGGVVVVSLPLTLINLVVAGRKGSKGPVRYPVLFGLLFQLLGVSVIYPMLWVPSYIFSESKLGVPTTTLRIGYATLLTLPTTILTFLVFYADTDSRLWTNSAGILGGPLLAMSGLALWTDESSSLDASPQNVAKSCNLMRKSYSLLGGISFLMYACLVVVSFRYYQSLTDLWKDVWVEAGPSVAFMTIDTLVLYLGVLIFIAYHNEVKAIKAFALTPFVGPGTACCIVMSELEEQAATELVREEKKGV
ncbi:hypothetical protein ACHAW6_013718 [Cyclotella cf. meneghiniana]